MTSFSTETYRLQTRIRAVLEAVAIGALEEAWCSEKPFGASSNVAHETSSEEGADKSGSKVSRAS